MAVFERTNSPKQASIWQTLKVVAKVCQSNFGRAFGAIHCFRCNANNGFEEEDNVRQKKASRRQTNG